MIIGGGVVGSASTQYTHAYSTGRARLRKFMSVGDYVYLIFIPISTFNLIGSDTS
jgi:hypothetical protein